MSEGKFRLITSNDLDGVASGALLQEKDMLGDVLFAHPKEIEDGAVAVSGNDVTANLPFAEGVHLCFDHHRSEFERVGSRDDCVFDPDAQSSARVIYNHFGGEKGLPEISQDMMREVDRASSALYSIEDIMAPEGWVLLNFILDGRSGLRHYKEFRIPTEQLMVDLMTYCRHTPIDEILQLPDVQERLEVYTYHEEFHELQISRLSEIKGDVVVTDLRKEDKFFPGNRFMVYALYPDCRFSISIKPLDNGKVELAMGKSIIKSSPEVHVGNLMRECGGGGPRGAGACWVDPKEADRLVFQLLEKVQG